MDRLPPWEYPPFWLIWNVPETQDQEHQVNQCSFVQLRMGDRRDSPVPSGPPYSLHIYGGSYPPVIIDAGLGPTYNWTADLPPGSTYMLEFKDGNGSSSGASPLLQVNETNAPTNCSIRQLPSNTLNLTPPEDLSQCSTIRLSVAEGIAPYTLEILPEAHPPKTISFDVADLQYTIDLQAGTGFFLIVRDSTNLVGVLGTLFVTNSSDTSCMQDPEKATTLPAIALSTTYSSPTASPGSNSSTEHRKTFNVAAAVGGIIGGIVLIALLLFFIFRLRRRRRFSEGNSDTYDVHPFISSSLSTPVSSPRPTDSFMTFASNQSGALVSPVPKPSTNHISSTSLNTSSLTQTSKWNSRDIHALPPGARPPAINLYSASTSADTPPNPPRREQEETGVPLEPPPGYHESISMERL